LEIARSETRSSTTTEEKRERETEERWRKEKQPFFEEPEEESDKGKGDVPGTEYSNRCVKKINSMLEIR
jgi:hypothetical protein